MLDNKITPEDGSPAPRMPSREPRLWLASLLLAAPFFLPYASHFMTAPGRLPTGFIQYDMPYYMANAREHFDNGRFQFFYSNPFDPRYEAPAIYVQPMSLMLGMILHATGADPGFLIIGFEILAAWACARVALALYAEIVGLGDWPRRLGLLAFFWGGGLLALAGIGYSLARQRTITDIFRFDPENGWWFLNFGRNLIYPTESLYHAFFFGSILCLLRQRFMAGAALAFLTSLSHPFTGVELLLILASWAALELFYVRSKAVPLRFLIAILGLLGVHFGYYLIYLTRFAEHRQLMETWKIAWELQAVNFLPAYALVGSLAFWSFRRSDIALRFFSHPRNRLFLTWFVVAFTLANHEFAIRSIQPLHFERGYIWTALFFMGATPLVDLLAYLQLRRPFVRVAATGLVMATLVLDNALWLAQFPYAAMTGAKAQGFTVTETQKDVFAYLRRGENRGSILLTSDPDLGYLGTVYTPLRSWVGHQYNTPDVGTRKQEVAAFLGEGKLLEAWSGKTLLIVVERAAPDSRKPPAEGLQVVHENKDYAIYRLRVGDVPPPR
ncbi:hypothetical protein TA3x_003691 [Tundrisphaera sp. TA3]|uniref:hypothetical protein n=1 Tax=Tundrisphaera sp. TA3 TaxID=3435775 RepID=UPI003EBE8691